jgi:hypothetical protein
LPAYITPSVQAANTPIPKLNPGIPAYSIGSRNNTVPTCRMQVTKSAVSSNTVTLTVQMLEGNIPAVNATAYVTGTQNDSGNLNSTSGVTLTAVSISTTTGQGTIQYTATASNLSATADTGLVIVPNAEVAEVLTTTYKGQQFAVSGNAISWAYTCPSAPSVIAIQLEGAIDDNDSEYTIIGSSETTTSGYNEFFATLPEFVRFVRIHVTNSSGGSSPTLIAKIMANWNQTG